ncbi:hypothetical protein LCGC14_1105550 [marine sediment metagenome]|uniref:Uncharacterized protein n=1 Tax=marine sediment metagenome TaxID=412755 RepID=A0A0F9PRC8_9ZZZZ
MTDITLVPTEDLVVEIKRRSASAVISYEITNGSNEAIKRTHWAGDPCAVMGMCELVRGSALRYSLDESFEEDEEEDDLSGDRESM